MAWSPRSWRRKPAEQQPPYPDASVLEEACETVGRLPPLVSPQEVDAVRAQLAEVAEGRRFLLQGGDCAERFMDCAAAPIEAKLKILLQMSLVLTWGARMPTLRIGRMAGQFSKPRSKPTEIVDGVEVASFRGDNVNSFDAKDRTPDPMRLVQGYFHSAATLNYARALLAGQFADLHSARHWDLGFVQDEDLRRQYQQMVDRILSALDFMRVVGVGDTDSRIRTVDLFTSHEGLTLPYEEALTRLVECFADGAAPTLIHDEPEPESTSEAEATVALTDAAAAASPDASAEATSASSSASSSTTASSRRYYNLGTHFLWIGDRTRQLDGAHIEYFRGIENPIGIKVGPSMRVEELVPLIRTLWPEPERTPGKIVLITRLGAKNVSALLPPYIRAVQEAGLKVVWCCDPMHGNTRTAAEAGLKTREFDDIVAEIRLTFEAHAAAGSHLGGVHFELTGENVTECTGGPEKISEKDLPRRYTTYCDPRLNYAQSMELAFLIARHLQSVRGAEVAFRDGLEAPLSSAWDRVLSIAHALPAPTGATPSSSGTATPTTSTPSAGAAAGGGGGSGGGRAGGEA